MERYHIYIILTRTNTVLSNLIRFAKKDEYTHAAISLDKNLDHMYSFGRKYTYNPFIGRFKEENINKGVYRLHKNLPGLIVEVEVSKEQYEYAKGLINHFISNSNIYKYNYKGLLYGLFNKETCCCNRFLCSEFVYHILKESNIVDFNIASNLVRPQSLLNVDNEIIYKGNLKEYRYANNSNSLKEIDIVGLSAV
ncbi:hypothetical protein AAGC94_09815 [Clostridium sporogenes]|uniref:hypothetical protein n=1 Tax=Clostridium TaxID=1485 RepID=UPI00214A89D8|nr:MULTISPECIES: hypothetical protein [Clostridium]MBE6043176.1 hypothetical protein [Clostridium thermopalmarium]MBE6065688.1 hypothetical protein [Clostridium cochlearium]MCR1971844.1 hypothetical protein [Clostridium cochlearium]